MTDNEVATRVRLPGTPSVLPRERFRALILPREHGAWGILLVPLSTGAAAGLIRGGKILPIGLFLPAAVILYWLRTPVESWLGAGPMRAQSGQERDLVLKAIAVLTAAALTALLALFWRGRNLALLVLGAAAALAFGAQASLKSLSRKTRVAAQVVGAIGLTCTAPGAYYASTGRFDRVACGLWLANWIFAGNQVHYVQTRIRGARIQGFLERCQHGQAFLEGHAAALAILLTAIQVGWLPLVALLAFVPAAVRGLVWFFEKPEALNVRRIGWMELVQALIFAILLIAAGFRA